jgi:hypothetical protein
MNAGLLRGEILPPTDWDWPEPSCFEGSQYTWMALNKLRKLIYLLIDNVPGAPPPDATTNQETICSHKC